MKKRYFVLGAFTALSLFALTSCGSEEPEKEVEPEPAPEIVDYSNYQVSQDEFLTATSKLTYDNYKIVEKYYGDSVSDANLGSTFTYIREGNWLSFNINVSGELINYYYYIDSSSKGETKITSYYKPAENAEVTSSLLAPYALDMYSQYIDDLEDVYKTLKFDETKKSYIDGSSYTKVSDTSHIDTKCSFKFENKKLMHSEVTSNYTFSGENHITVMIDDFEYGNFKVTVPQEVLDYHNANYNK